MHGLVVLLAISYMAAFSTDATEAQMHRKKIIIGRRNGPEQLPLWSENSNTRSFSMYDLDGDGFLSQREFYSLPLCRDPPPCDLTMLAEELKDELKTEQSDWRR
ncbi:uncharacterized protein [Diadema antillarum]|uniref:uncharacterized protein n=1 Tax=Diadema antillarum TaxID=105358 RepID=UPI003A849946